MHERRPLPTSASSGGGDSGDVAARVKELEGALADTRRQHQTELEALQGERLHTVTKSPRRWGGG